MTKEKKINILVLIILTGFILAVIYHYILGVVLHYPSPLNSFLFNPADQLNDFRNVYKEFANPYFPFGNLIIYIFCLIRPMNFSLILFLTLSFAPIIYYFWSNLQVKHRYTSIINTIVFSLFTFPILFLFDRGNFESFVFLFLILFAVLYQKGKTYHAIIPLSFAIAMKLFPAIFVLLFFSDRKYKHIFWTGILVIIITLLSTWPLPGGVIESFSELGRNTSGYMQLYVIGDWGLDFGHTIFGLIKITLYSINLGFLIPYILKPYMILVFLLGSIVSLYVVFIEKELWKKVVLIVIAMNLLPHVSADYKLVYLFIPIFLFINLKNDSSSSLESKKRFFDKQNKLDYLYIILFGLLLIPKNYRVFSYVYDGVILDPILMIALSYLIIRDGVNSIDDRKREIIKKIKKVSLYFTLGFILFAVGGIVFLFTTKGNKFVETQIATQLSNRFNTHVRFNTFRFTTNEVNINLGIDSVASINFSLTSQNDSLSGIYKINVIDANRISKRFCEKFEFSTHGKIIGSGITTVQLDGAADIFNGNAKYRIDLKNFKISHVQFVLKRIQVEDAMASINKKEIGIEGSIDFYGNIGLKNRRPISGNSQFSADSIKVNDPTFINKWLGFEVPNNIGIKINSVTQFKGDKAISALELHSDIANVKIKESTLNLKTRELSSDYLIKIPDLTRIIISDSANIGLINNQINGIKTFKYILDTKYQLGISIEGNLKTEANLKAEANRKSESKKYSINGCVLGFSEANQKQSASIVEGLVFQMEDEVLVVKDSICLQ